MSTEFLAEAAGLLEGANPKDNVAYKMKRKLVNGDYVEGFMDSITGEYYRGTRICSNTGEIYEGPFWRGKRHGDGAVATQMDGSKFLGRYCNDQPQHGTWITEEFTYTGSLYVWDEKDSESGSGHALSKQCRTPFHGYGKLCMRNGPVYEGEFRYGLYHGVGKETMSDKSRYTGNFENGERHGIGTLVKADGTCQSGVWVHDNIISNSASTVNNEGPVSNEDSIKIKKTAMGENVPYSYAMVSEEKKDELDNSICNVANEDVEEDETFFEEASWYMSKDDEEDGETDSERIESNEEEKKDEVIDVSSKENLRLPPKEGLGLHRHKHIPTDDELDELARLGDWFSDGDENQTGCEGEMDIEIKEELEHLKNS